MKKHAVASLVPMALLSAFAVFAQEDAAEDDAGRASQDSAVTPNPDADEAPVSDDIFIPSEEVQAAEELTFPVNI